MKEPFLILGLVLGVLGAIFDSGRLAGAGTAFIALGLLV